MEGKLQFVVVAVRLLLHSMVYIYKTAWMAGGTSTSSRQNIRESQQKQKKKQKEVLFCEPHI